MSGFVIQLIDAGQRLSYPAVIRHSNHEFGEKLAVPIEIAVERDKKDLYSPKYAAGPASFQRTLAADREGIHRSPAEHCGGQESACCNFDTPTSVGCCVFY